MKSGRATISLFSFLLVLFCCSASARPLSSELVVELATDRACYSPGEEVRFTVTSIKKELPSGTMIRYRHGSEVVEEHKYSEKVHEGKWSWTAPYIDFRGYMVDIYCHEGDGEKVLGAIAVDVSSDWKRFPRYGFVADFEEYGDNAAKKARIESEMAYLNRCHINGVQFQDWHWMHHYPVKFNDDGTLAGWYQDISWRWIGAEHIKRYIDVQHGYGMKSIFYNLCFGAWKDAEEQGVKPEWGLFAKKDDGTFFQDRHELNGWQSDIFLENPANTEWQEYMCKRNDEVYGSFGFDGYQIDQLGGRSWRSSDGKIYDYYGNEIDLPSGYASFINAMKGHNPDKSLIMNAVSGYGAEAMLRTGKVDFCYNEVWGGSNGYGGGNEEDFTNLYGIIKDNDRFSDHQFRTVFAAYMNYDKAGSPDGTDRMMNTPGVLLTDAVIFALGGSHLELGDHMLSREYFPAAPLAMSDELKTAMVHYYDFMTAYQNLLRDKSSKYAFSANVSTTQDVNVCAWPPKANSIVTYSKNVGTSQVVHLLNFRDTDDLTWRDVNGTRNEPPLTENLPIAVAVSKTVTKVWVATPDAHGGALQELDFTQTDGTVRFTIPSLKYWTMVVLESEKVEQQLLAVGDALSTGWNTGAAPALHPNVDGSVFSGNVYLEAGKPFKFINGKDYGTCVHYNAEYENFNFNQEYGINTANVIANAYNDFQNGANDYKFTVGADGYYNVTLDLNTMRIKVDMVGLVTIGSTGYATYCSDRPLDFKDVDGLKAYIATGAKGTDEVLKLVIQNVQDVPAFTGLMLHGKPGEYAVPLGTGNTVFVNMFRGVTEATDIKAEESGYKNFLLADGSCGIGFYPAKDGTLAANKAYLSLPKSAVALAKALVFSIDDDATGISGITAGSMECNTCYTLTGLRVSNLSKGIYIHNGKKIVVR